MEKNILVAPSILSADMLKLGEEIERMTNLGIKYLHFDVMDGHFVNNISYGVPVLKSIGHKFNTINDVHLMITNPNDFIEPFVKAGADSITFHYEAFENDEEVAKCIGNICSFGIKCGISIKPGTSVKQIERFLPFVDMVLVMSVEPGFGGQSFLMNSIDKIKELNERRIKSGFNYLIEVDGGINSDTAKFVKEAGVDIMVSGSYLFKADNLLEAYEGLIK